MVHQAVERLVELRDRGQGTSSQHCLVRLQPEKAGTKRARPRSPVEPGTSYLKSVTYGGRGNFLPVEAPVVFKRSLIAPLQKDTVGGGPEIVAKVCLYCCHLIVPWIML